MGKKIKKVAGAAIAVAGVAIAFFNPAIGAGLMVAGGAIAATGTKPPDEGEYSEGTPIQRDQGHQVNTRSASRPLPLIYGLNTVGVNITFYHNDNPYLYMICEVGEGVLDGIEKIDNTTFNETARRIYPSDQCKIYFDDKIWTDFLGTKTDLAHMEWFEGNDTQVPVVDLQDAYAGYNEYLRHTAYLYVKLKFDKDVFKSIPKITLRVAGLKVYGIPASPPNKSRSANPANVIQDLIVRPGYRGGLGLPLSKIHEQSFADTAFHCYNNLPSNMANLIETDLLVINNISMNDIVKMALEVIPAELVHSYQHIKLLFLNINYEPVVMSFDENDIHNEGGKDSINYTGLKNSRRPNAIRAYFTNWETGKSETFTFVDPNSSNEDYRETTINLHATNDVGWVQILSYYYLERARTNRTLNVVVGQRGFPLEAIDLITLTYARWGWSNKLFRVTNAQRMDNGLVVLTAQAERIEYYDNVYQITEATIDDTSLPDPTAIPASVTLESEFEERTSYRQRSFTRWVINFNPPPEEVDPFWDYAEVWMRLGTNAKYYDFDDKVKPDGLNYQNIRNVIYDFKTFRFFVESEAESGSPNAPGCYFDKLVTTDIQPALFTKVKYDIRFMYDNGVDLYDPSLHWYGQVFYTNADWSIQGRAQSKSAPPPRSGEWVTIDVDLVEDYHSGNRWGDIVDLEYLYLTMFVINFPYSGMRFEVDNISLGSSYSAGQWRYITRSAGNYALENVVENTEYWLKFVSVNIWKTKENFDKALTIQRKIKGLISTPGGVWGFAAFHTDGVDLIFNGVWRGLVDIAGFEIRREGADFQSGYFIGSIVSNTGNVSVHLDRMIPNDDDGPFTFHVAPYNNRGLYGAEYSQTIDTNEPDSYVYTPETDVHFDYSTGILNGTERYFYNGAWYLRVNHTDGNLSGSWISPVWQFSNQTRVRMICGSFRIVPLSAEYTFEGIWGTDRTFGDIDSELNKRFRDLFSTDFAPVLVSRIEFGTTTAVEDGEFALFHRKMFECEARYYRVTITIEDPADGYYLMVKEQDFRAWRAR